LALLTQRVCRSFFNQPQKEGLGTLAARLFSQVGLDDDAEFKLPEREHYPPVSFDE
jgi:hypothetical protein